VLSSQHAEFGGDLVSLGLLRQGYLYSWAGVAQSWALISADIHEDILNNARFLRMLLRSELLEVKKGSFIYPEW
jgi:hypothetical protein